MRVIKTFKSAVMRQIEEAVLINGGGLQDFNLNSKNEWMAPKVPKIMMEAQAGRKHQDFKGRKELGKDKPVPEPKRSRPKLGAKDEQSRKGKRRRMNNSN